MNLNQKDNWALNVSILQSMYLVVQIVKEIISLLLMLN